MKQGFTLLELSIVLVIIGLIIGGVTVGADMIRSAELNSVVTDINKYKTAINAFKLKYNQLPGDMKNASSYWPALGNGDGDGDIENQGYGSYENIYAWQHMSEAEVISGTFVTPSPLAQPTIPGEHIPASKISGGGYNFTNRLEFGATLRGVFPSALNKQLLIFSASGGVNHVGVNAILTPADAKSVDMKSDDGAVGTGKTQGGKPNSGLSIPQNCATTEDPATATYALDRETVECNLIFILD